MTNGDSSWYEHACEIIRETGFDDGHIFIPVNDDPNDPDWINEAIRLADAIVC